MAWFDNLFAPPMFGQSAGLAPNSYDMFRALYPPHTRPMPEQPQMPYAPPMNRAMRMPQQAPNPIEPQLGGASTEGVLPAGWTPELIMPAAKAMMGTIPGIGPVMRGNMDSEVANRDPIRVNKPNVMPASNPPPMMGRAGELPPGVNPPGAMGMGDLGYPGAMTMPNAQSAAPKPGFWERNADTLGPDGKLWGPLAALGRGMAQPSWYGPAGQLSQGLGEATQAAQTGPMQRAQRRLLEAQVGKAEQETDMRKQAIALGKELPAGHPAKKYFQMGMVKEGLEKIDPDYNKLIIVGPDGKPQINEMAVKAQSAVRAAGQPVVNVALPKAETAAGKLLNDITRIKEQLTKDPSNPTLQAAIRTAETSLKNEGITEGMRKASGFASRAERSEQSLESLAGKGYDTPSLWDQMTAGGGWKNFMASGKGQQYMQAARDWIGAILRYDSGAAVPDTEFARYFQAYFPQPGDDAATVAQKRAARQGIINELKSQSGGAYETYFPEGARKPATNSGRTKSGWDYEKMP